MMQRLNVEHILNGLQFRKQQVRMSQEWRKVFSGRV
jgi:hypothetical protein